MTDEHIEKTKSAIESAENIPADRKDKLIDLLSKIKTVIDKISKTQHENARSIDSLLEASAQETIRAQKKPEQHLLHELKQSVQNFEATHPQLAAFVNQYSTVLSALGF
jgi:ABC-type transporter Mla subunit MlaD